MKTIDKYSERLKSLIRARLEAVCSVPANWDFNQLLIGYFTIYSRRIENKKRKVVKSKEFTCPADLLSGLQFLESKISNGEDLNPHQSRTIIKSDYQEKLFFDWGIVHFHLGTEFEESRPLIKGTKYVVFAIVTDEIIYFINTYDHGHWEEVDVLNIVVSNWPELLAGCMVDGESEIEIGDQEVKDFRKVGLNTAIKLVDGNSYLGRGGGYTASGNSNQAMIDFLGFKEALDTALQEMESECPDIDDTKTLFKMEGDELRAIFPEKNEYYRLINLRPL